MKTVHSIVLSFLTCAISFPVKLFDRSEWPTVSYEEAEQLGNWIHRMNSYWVTTVRKEANFFSKLFAFATVLEVILAVVGLSILIL